MIFVVDFFRAASQTTAWLNNGLTIIVIVYRYAEKGGQQLMDPLFQSATILAGQAVVIFSFGFCA